MALDPLHNAEPKGKPEYDKFLQEIKRKYALLDILHDEVLASRANIKLQTGYDKLDMMVEIFTPVQTEIEDAAREMQDAINKLQNWVRIKGGIK